MIHPNGYDRGNIVAQEPPMNETTPSAAVSSGNPVQPVDVATREKQRAKQQVRQNRFLILGALVVALMIVVVTSMPSRNAIQTTKNGVATTKGTVPSSAQASADKSIPHYQFRAPSGQLSTLTV